MGPWAVVALIAAIILVIILVAVLIYNATKADEDPLANAPGHDHSHGGAAGCAACQAAAAAIKKKIPMKCMVQFRPLDSWKGEYGFDWLRIGGGGGELEAKSYKELINGGFGFPTAANAYTFGMKPEFKNTSVPTEIKSKPEDLKEYFVPYLNLFPEKYVKALPQSDPTVPLPLFEAELKILITVERDADEPDKIELEYDGSDKNLLELKCSFGDKTKKSGVKRLSSDTLKIKCLQDLSSDVEVRVLAYPKGWKSKNDATLAGKLLVSKNDTSTRKEMKYVLVKVATKVKNTVKVGVFSNAELKRLKDSLHQALIHGTFENGHDLNLRNDKDYKVIKKSGKNVFGKFIFKTDGSDGNIPNGLNEDFPNDATPSKEAFFIDLRTKYLAVKGNAKYNNHFTVFCFKEPTYDPVTYGQIQKFGVKNLALFLNPGADRPDGVAAHEAGHGLGLEHTHESAKATINKFVYPKGVTDNIMSYNFPAMMSTWHWQWEVMRNNAS